MKDLEQAWDEGWTSSEILKRYTTATMGPCRARCAAGTSRSAPARRAPGSGPRAARPPPPARSVGWRTWPAASTKQVEKRTALHDTHLAAGATAGLVRELDAPLRYGDVAKEYRAVRERVSLMDVARSASSSSAAGRRVLLDRVFPCRVRDLAPGRARYLLALDEAGYVMDDGLVCALPDGALLRDVDVGRRDKMEAWLRNWADRWDLHAHLVNQTAMRGAINVAGPHARELLATPVRRRPLDAAALPSGGHADDHRRRRPVPRRSARASWASCRSSCTTRARGASSCGTR